MKITIKELKDLVRKTNLIKEEVLPREFLRRFDTDVSQITTTAKELWEAARHLRSTGEMDQLRECALIMARLEEQMKAAQESFRDPEFLGWLGRKDPSATL